MCDISVVKRDGSIEKFNVEKIKKAIEFACEGLDVNSLKLESKFDEFIVNGVTTESIQQNLIVHAKNLATPKDDKWVIVSGRLSTMDLWNKTRAYEKPFHEFLQNMIDRGVYKHEGLFKYTEQEIVELGKEINQEYDLAHSISSVTTFQSKYLINGECIQQVMMVNAMIYASVEKTPELKMKYAKRWYHKFAKRKLSKATPHWTGLRFGGNVGSCFVLAINDSIDSIMDNAKNVAKISKEGGGVGVYAGYIRGKGDMIGGEYGLSGGVLPMLKIFNDTIVAFNQRGRRKGAITIALPFWHVDILDFIDSRSEVGDLRAKLFDTQLQVVIEDLFMRMKEEDKTQTWYTFSPHEVEKVLGFNLNDYSGKEFDSHYNQAVVAYKSGKLKIVNEFVVNDIWKLLLKHIFEKGTPYVVFGTTLQFKNPNKHEGKIHSLNLCVESSSNFSPDTFAHTCSLLSIVVGRSMTREELIEDARDATRILANTLTLNSPPIQESKAHIDRYRTIGVGIQGLVDWLARENRPYSDIKSVTEVAELVQWGCLLESVELAKERGAYPAFEGSRWSTGEQIDDYIRDSVSDLTDWVWMKDQVMTYGVYCSQHTSPAPNTSTAIAMDAGAGVDPSYAPFFYEDNKNGKIPVTSMYLDENPLFYSKTFGMYDQVAVTKAIGALQKFVDTSISAEYVLDRNVRPVTGVLINDIYNSAWKEGCKAVYYLRTIKEGDSLVETSDVCASCSG